MSNQPMRGANPGGMVSLIACVLAVTCHVASAQAQARYTLDEANAATSRLLQSSDAREVAWGAFTATQYHVVSAVPLLIAALQRDLSADPVTRDAVELAILDALVQLDAQVPVDALRRSLGTWPIPTLILLDTATGDRDAILLERLEVTAGFEWRAVANLLMRSKPAGFAYRLLDGLPLQLTIYVADQSNVGFGGGSAGGATEGCNVEFPAPGLPPSAYYRFVTASAGATLLSTGPDAVYYRRQTRMPPTIPCTNRGRVQKPGDLDRLTYLNALVRTRFEAVPLQQATSVTLVWRGSQTFREEVARHRRSLVDRHQHVLSLLVLAKQLTDDERGRLPPHVALTVIDKRKDRSHPLPAYDGKP